MGSIGPSEMFPQHCGRVAFRIDGHKEHLDCIGFLTERRKVVAHIEERRRAHV
jgi:hypothetical protein